MSSSFQHSSIVEDYPDSYYIINAGYPSLYSHEERSALRTRASNPTGGERYIVENPVYTKVPKGKDRFLGLKKNGLDEDSAENEVTSSTSGGAAMGMRTKDFLASIPAFSDFSDEQLTTLEQKAEIQTFTMGEIVFRQGDAGKFFYIINRGAVQVLVSDSNKPSLNSSSSSLGKVVNRLTEGCYFGERALMTAEPRAATIRVCEEKTVCLLFSRSVYEEIISGSSALLGQGDALGNVDWSKDHETRSLFRHVEHILEIGTNSESSLLSPRVRRILYELTTAFTPELSPDEVISRMVMTVKMALKVDRVGLFVLSEDKRSMILKVSERAKGVRLPVRGIAGAVLLTNQAINIPDAYQDSRFDATMDRRTGYRTRQILGVPLRHPLTGEAIGLLQVNNRMQSETSGATGDGSGCFNTEEQRILELAAEQLSELLHGRTEVFLQGSTSNAAGPGNLTSGPNKKAIGQGAGDGVHLINSAEVTSPFQVELQTVRLSGAVAQQLLKDGCSHIELQVSLHLAFHSLCLPQRLWVDLTPARAANSSASSPLNIKLQERLEFDIAVCNLPRATRILFKIFGRSRRKSAAPPPPNAIVPALCWVAATLFDFKGCLEPHLDALQFFSGDTAAPMSTTLNNLTGSGGPSPASLSAVCAPDLILLDGDFSLSPAVPPRVRLVHSMPGRKEAMVIEGQGLAGTSPLTESARKDLARILSLSFHPMANTVVTEQDKALLWDLRYHILDRPDLLPAFVMTMQWESSQHVQELYDLLDLWTPPSPVQALQLLDRRLMDPKVRAFAAHCLEDLPDDELALYMLQLCQQLKFENYVDSALSRFLLRRALTNQRVIGHIYYWLLQSEVYNKDVSKRFIILLQVYIRNCGSHRIELGHQVFVMKRLEHVAEQVKLGDSKESRKKILHDRLKEIVLPTTFKLPLNPHLKVCGIDVSRCQVMESKKKPLLLTLKDADGGQDIVLIVKVGDDLRQDALIMQLLRVMNELWVREGFDMQMKLYGCISTGYERGLLQVVQNAKTLGKILADATDKKNAGMKSGSLSRKISSAIKAFTDFSFLGDWIAQQVDDELAQFKATSPHGVPPFQREEEIEFRVQNFIISTAAYCVASYLLGLGDRHNDNLMMTKSGHFFHIDFGHILGNFKSKMGVKRERAPFVFTHAMKAVMKEEDQYSAFTDLCCDIYNILREHSALLVSLFSLAIPCNLPELQEEKDVMWIYEKLLVGATEDEAADHFRKQLEISLNTKTTRLNDAAHMLAHA